MTIKKRLKSMQKDAFDMTKAGIGLGVAANAVVYNGQAPPVTKFTGKLPLIGGVVATGHTIGIIQDSFKVKKKRRK